jgi:hypothetical protein
MRHARSRPIVEALHVWLQHQVGRVSGVSDLAEALGERDASRLQQQTLQGSWPVFHGDARWHLIRRTAVVRTRMPGGVGGAASRMPPIPIDGHKRGATLNQVSAPRRRDGGSRTSYANRHPDARVVTAPRVLPCPVIGSLINADQAPVFVEMERQPPAESSECSVYPSWARS